MELSNIILEVVDTLIVYTWLESELSAYAIYARFSFTKLTKFYK
jgi:hypothetical protein